ncbi:MAG: hypothetical protein AAGC55_14905 [Myxococcota bacterium]
MTTLLDVERMIPAGATQRELLDALDRVDLPPEQDFLRHSMRVLIADVCHVADPPLNDIAAYLAAAPPLKHRASKLVAWSAVWPELRIEHLPGLISELEAHHNDPVCADWARLARRVLDRADHR